MNKMQELFMGIKGQNCRVTYRKELKTRKGVKVVVTKTTEATFKAGINSDRRVVTQEARANGDLPAENQGLLPGYSWVTFPYILHYAPKDRLYWRFYPSSGAKTPPRIVYRNETSGEEITKEQAQALCLASEFSNREKKETDCYNIPQDNILAINGVAREEKDAA